MSYDLGKGVKCMRCNLQLCTCARDAKGKPTWIVDMSVVDSLKARVTALETENIALKARLSNVEKGTTIIPKTI